MRWLKALLPLTLGWAAIGMGDEPSSVDPAPPVVSAVPETLQLDPFYRKYTDAAGIAIVGSDQVPDQAIRVAHGIVNHLLANRNDLRSAMVARRMRVIVMAQSESTTDLPEQKDWKKPTRDDPRLTTGEKDHYDDKIGKLTDKEYWDGRARGMGGNPTSCAEENLLGYPGTRYYGENILVHEFAHGIMDIGIRRADPDLYREIKEAYRAAMDQGLWSKHYAATTAAEYWAEGTQTWFWSNYEYNDKGRVVMTPDDLKAYDPRLYDLLARVYADHKIPDDRYHAQGLRPGRRPPSAVKPSPPGP